jgi:hypothetical protein
MLLSEHDYVIDRSIDYVQKPHNAYSGQGANEFGVAILDDSIHDYVRDDDVSASTEGMTLASTTKDHGVDKERQ